jgi:hypothetical protein
MLFAFRLTRKCLELRYDGFSRIVEVHTVGIAKQGEGMSVWQVRGGSKSGERQGFKVFYPDKSFSAHMLDEKSDAPRRGYKRNDPTFKTIFCQL